MIGYDWDGGHPLSVDDHNCRIHDRVPHRLLRPIYVNAVEVGYAHLVGDAEEPIDEGRRLSVRGVALALWYFICRGHQAIGILPYCFKKYVDKSDNWTVLMEMYRMNLIEFTPGFGPEKYSEVNRIIAYRARSMGGCMVARSQMHGVVEDHPILDKTVERRLLMPSFNGDDIIFPIDGPLGRSGVTFRQTVVCSLGEVDWPRVAVGQMILKDQRIWLRRLSVLFPENERWNVMSHMVSLHQSEVTLVEPPDGYPSVDKTIHRIHPPETNPVENPGFSSQRFKRGNFPRGRFNAFNYDTTDTISKEKDYEGLFFPSYVTKQRISHMKLTEKELELEYLLDREGDQCDFECDCCSASNAFEHKIQSRLSECSDCGTAVCSCEEQQENAEIAAHHEMSDVLEEIMKDKELDHIGGLSSIYQFKSQAPPKPEAEKATLSSKAPTDAEKAAQLRSLVEMKAGRDAERRKKAKTRLSDEELWKHYRSEFRKQWKAAHPSEKPGSRDLFEYLEAKAKKCRVQGNPECAVIEHLCRQQKRRRERRSEI
ncbi:hypothetical protein L596_026149 [Steinernema carpocapsae]|uniref:RNase NYN domain-containing protein n=1 Tax=Steinernema carpocapsae TaxID=34508 RepID=A0A4U5M1H4_STECR|nr:hypothetical protein L596_026149 [Steinernema carpocapsae]